MTTAFTAMPLKMTMSTRRFFGDFMGLFRVLLCEFSPQSYPKNRVGSSRHAQ